MSIKEFDVKDLNLAEQGRWRIDWALKEMPVMRSLMDRFNKERPLDGVIALVQAFIEALPG